MRNESRSAPRVTVGIGGFAALQRTDPIHRSALLSVDRNEVGHFRRARLASPLSRTRRHRHQRTLLERFFLVTADACADRGPETNSVLPRSARLSSGLCHRIRLLSTDSTTPHARIKASGRSVLRRTGQRNHRLRGGGGPGHRGRYQCSPALRGEFVLHLAPRRSLHRGTHRRLGDERRGRTLSHVHLARRVSHPPAPRQRRRATHSLCRTFRHGYTRTLPTLSPKTKCHRGTARGGPHHSPQTDGGQRAP